LQRHHPDTYQNTADLIQCPIQNFLADSIMSSGVVVCCILLPADQQLWVEQLSVITSADLVDWRRVQIHKDRPRNIFSRSCLCKYGIKLARVVERLRVGIGATVLLETMLKEVPSPHC